MKPHRTRARSRSGRPERVVVAALFAAGPVSAAPAASTPRAVVCLDGAPASAAAGEAAHAWWGWRAADLLAQHLVDLGFVLSAPRSLPPASAELSALRTRATVRPGASPEVTWIVRDGGAEHQWTGAIDDLEAAAAEVATAVARSRGGAPMPAASLGPPRPMTLHRLMGRARQRELAERPLQAALMYERASRLGGRYWYEAARAASNARSRATGNLGDAELAQAAQVRARVAARAGDAEAEADAWRAFLKYTPRRLRPWSIPLPLPRTTAVASTRRRLWVEAGARRLRIELPAPRGVEEDVAPAGQLAAAGPEFLVVRDGLRIARVDAQGPQWTLRSPVGPVGGGRVASGFVAIWGEDGGAWVDTGRGRLRERFDGAVLAAGDRGVLVRRPGAVAFFRAGQSSPAWSLELEDGSDELQAILTEDRVLLRRGDQLRVLRARSGRPVGDPIPLNGRALLHAAGRTAVVAGPERYQLIDTSTGAAHPPRSGPGAAVSAVARSRGAAIAFEGGDVFLVGPEGALEARLLLARAPHQLVAREDFGLVIAVASDGLHAIADLRGEEATDVHALLALARLGSREGRPGEARRLAEWAARAVGGPLAAVEAFRGGLLPPGPARDWAVRRSLVAADPMKTLGEVRALHPGAPVVEEP